MSEMISFVRMKKLRLRGPKTTRPENIEIYGEVLRDHLSQFSQRRRPTEGKTAVGSCAGNTFFMWLLQHWVWAPLFRLEVGVGTEELPCAAPAL